MLRLIPVIVSPACSTALLDVARAAVLARLKPDADLPFVPPTHEEMLKPAGCFVTLHEHKTRKLRGCVGRLDADQPLWQTVFQTAGDVLHDPRFVDDPVKAAELEALELEISVLSPPRAAASPLDFDPMEDGIYLVMGGRAGFFLPQVARETGWSKEQLLERLCSEKLGMPPDAWQQPGATLYTFKVQVIGPEHFALPPREKRRADD
jgi:AmmeMemoRadiSam system protein A